MSWKNARQLSVSSLVPGLKCQEDVLALLVDAPRAEDRFAGKAGTEPLGDAVDEQVEELVLREVPGRERRVLLPESLGHLAHRRPRQERPPLLVGEPRCPASKARGHTSRRPAAPAPRCALRAARAPAIGMAPPSPTPAAPRTRSLPRRSSTAHADSRFDTLGAPRRRARSTPARAGPLPRLQALPRRACARRGGSDRSGRRGLRLPPAAPRSAHPSAAMLESACFPWEHLLLGFPAVIGHDPPARRVVAGLVADWAVNGGTWAVPVATRHRA